LALNQLTGRIAFTSLRRRESCEREQSPSRQRDRGPLSVSQAAVLSPPHRLYELAYACHLYAEFTEIIGDAATYVTLRQASLSRASRRLRGDAAHLSQLFQEKGPAGGWVPEGPGAGICL